MQFSATFRHIDNDFGFEGLELGQWSADYEDEDALILALNRMAIASSQHSVVDFPEMEVRANSLRVTVRAIDGQLFYTDLHSLNRKDLKVVPTEVVSLLRGKSVEEVFKAEEPVLEQYLPSTAKPYRTGSSWYIKAVALVLMFVVLGFCSEFIWRDISKQPRLHAVPQFIPSLSQESDVLRKYADVYVSEYREGSMLFELTREGQFTRYEMWYSEDRNGFVLINIGSSKVQVGQHNGQTAMLANGVYLLMPIGEEIISLHGIRYSRHHGALASIGEVLGVKR